MSRKGKTTLYAVSPQGRKFAFYSWPASARTGPSSFSLVDWSGDRQPVLVGNGFSKFEQISLVTGKVISTFKLPPRDVVISYTKQAEASARSIAGRQRTIALAAVVKAVAMNGSLDKAEAIAGSISVPGQQGAARAAIVSVTAAKGNMQRATGAALAIHDR